jgi:murein DD-endopeptidase MepM/ murein hydrolase activator NlpD
MRHGPVQGRRRAERPSRKPLPRLHLPVHLPGHLAGHLAGRLPNIPTVVGVVALAIAGAGAVAVNPAPASSSAIQVASGSTALNGTDAVGFTGDPRERAISRDSERQALEDASEVKLQRAAEQQAAERNAELKSLGKAAEARAGEIAKNQWQLPTTGYHLTARFGMAGGLWSSNHTGLDFATASGTPIVAVANGKITKTGSAGAYGNQTIETLEDGTEIWYCHQTDIGVSPGDTVSAGQQIGTVGSTGNTTGPHLHLEVRPGGGDPVDPFQALVFHGLKP